MLDERTFTLPPRAIAAPAAPRRRSTARAVAILAVPLIAVVAVIALLVLTSDAGAVAGPANITSTNAVTGSVDPASITIADPVPDPVRGPERITSTNPFTGARGPEQITSTNPVTGGEVPPIGLPGSKHVSSPWPERQPA